MTMTPDELERWVEKEMLFWAFGEGAEDLAVHAAARAIIAKVREESDAPEEQLARAVGERVYERISEMMDAKAGTPEGSELALLAALVADVEEYGFALTPSETKEADDD